MAKTKEERRAYAKAYYAANKKKFVEYNRAYHEAHRKDRLEYHAAYHAKNRAAQNEKRKAYHTEHKEADNANACRYRTRRPEFIKEIGAKYRAEHREEARRRAAEWHDGMTTFVKTALGGKCGCCSVAEYEFLTLDHIASDGGGSVKKRGSNHYAYREVELAFKSGDLKAIEKVKTRFENLCWNCNLSKRNEGICRHRRGPRSDDGLSPAGVNYRKLSREVRTLLGARCVCCGEDGDVEFLAVDHVQNDGHFEKKNKNGSREVQSYYAAIVRAFRSNDSEKVAAVKARFAVRCHNCNESKHYGKGLCIHERKACA